MNGKINNLINLQDICAIISQKTQIQKYRREFNLMTNIIRLIIMDTIKLRIV